VKNPEIGRWRSAFPGSLFWVVVLILTSANLILLEEKYNTFSGGFLLIHRVASLGDRSIFLTLLFLLESSLAYFFWCLFTLIGIRRNLPARQAGYLFLFLYGGGSAAIMVAKYQILTYFGDFLSLAVMRNLGGGSLLDGVMYGLQEGLHVGLIVALGALGCWFSFRILTRRLGPEQRGVSAASQRVVAGAMLLSLVGLVGLGGLAHSISSMSKHFAKTIPYALANAALRGIMPAENSPLAVLLGESRRLPARSPPSSYQLEFPQRKENLILIISESTRPDALDAQVDGQPVAPVWRSLAAQGEVGRMYFSHTGFTTSSLKAMFRSSLGANLPLGGTLFEVLKAQGYQVVVLSGQDESFGDIAAVSGMERTADIFFDARSAKNDRVFSSAAPGSLTLSNARVVQQFDEVVKRLDWTRPVFMYVNFQGAHFPYFHPKMPLVLVREPLARSKISEDQRSRLRLTYLNAVAYSDWATGQIVQQLKQVGAYDRSLIAVAGDHGESLFDDGILGHGIRITDKQMHALLVANRPIHALDGLVGQQDLAKYLLQGIGVKFSPGLPVAQAPVIQMIGSMSNPSELGYVYKDGRRLTINLADDEVSASWLDEPVKILSLMTKSRTREEALHLVAEWNAIAH
jgi:phosphoglycerol transferase MdoB-like AlkP superfamily enzyme